MSCARKRFNIAFSRTVPGVLQILVVDDSPTIRKMVMAALQPLRPTFVEAGSGLDAIEQLALRRFDLMTLDLNMPDMHGLEVIAFVRSHATFVTLPIVVLSTRSDDASRQAALTAGATQYCTKPFVPAAFLGTVSAVLEPQAS